MLSGVTGTWLSVATAIRRAVPIFFSWRMLAVVALPVLGAALAWILLGYFALNPLSRWLAQQWFGESYGWGAIFAAIVAALAFAAGAVLTALLVVAFIAMPVVVAQVAQRDFAQLAARHGGTIPGSLWNAAAAVGVFVILWILCLPLLWLPPLYVAALLVLSAWLNQRIFRYDALAVHADASEIGTVIWRSRRKLMVLGLTLAPLSLVPFVNLMMPLFAGIAFTYLCLDELRVLRSETPVGVLGNRA